MRRLTDVAWAAGLFEGEGSITHTRDELRVTLVNCDREVVEQFDRVVERGRIYGPYTSDFGDGCRRKPRWVWVARGDAGHDVLDLLGAWLSTRRRSQAEMHGVILGATARTGPE
jgi:hypothetical protein